MLKSELRYFAYMKHYVLFLDAKTKKVSKYIIVYLLIKLKNNFIYTGKIIRYITLKFVCIYIYKCKNKFHAFTSSLKLLSYLMHSVRKIFDVLRSHPGH